MLCGMCSSSKPCCGIFSHQRVDELECRWCREGAASPWATEGIALVSARVPSSTGWLSPRYWLALAESGMMWAALKRSASLVGSWSARCQADPESEKAVIVHWPRACLRLPAAGGRSRRGRPLRIRRMPCSASALENMRLLSRRNA